MAHILTIRLHDDASDAARVDWVAWDTASSARKTQHTGRLSEAATEAAGRRVMVYVPSRYISQFTVRLPSRNPKKVAQALPFALEERLAEDVAKLHFAPLHVNGDGEHLVAVVKKDQMQKWLDQLAYAGIVPDVLCADVFLVPAQDNGWAVAEDNDTLLVRTGAYQGFCVAGESADSVLALWLSPQSESAPERLTIKQANEESALVETLEKIAAEANIEVAKEDFSPDSQLLSFVDKSLDASQDCNLLQGAFKLSHDMREQWRRWRMTACLALVLVAITLVWQGVQYYRLSSQNSALHAQIVTLFHKALPDAPTTGDMHGRILSHLIQLKKNASQQQSAAFMSTVAAVGESMGKSQQLLGLSWKNSTLSFKIKADNAKTFDRFRSKIESKTGRKVTIDSAQTKDDAVVSQMHIAEAP